MCQKFVSILFRLSTITFLFGGLAIVVGQGAGLILGDGRVVTDVSALLAPYVYGSAGVAGLLAFVMSYAAHDEEDVVDPDGPEIRLDSSVPVGSDNGSARWVHEQVRER